MDSYQKFEDAIVEYWEAQGTSSVRRPYWSMPASPLLEIPLLEKLLTVAVRDGSSAQSGSLAKALDMWVAEELRAAGFDAQSVWPRLVRPRVLDPSVLQFSSAHWMARTAGKMLRGPSLALPAPTPACSGRPIASRSMWGYPLG